MYGAWMKIRAFVMRSPMQRKYTAKAAHGARASRGR